MASLQPAQQHATPTTQNMSDRAGRRARLRDYQTHLVDRMQAARSGTELHRNQLGVMIGTSRLLLDLRQAGEIMTIAEITPVPLTQDWYRGLVNVRGNLIGVIDLARFQGEEVTAVTKESRIVAFAPLLGFNCGLLVSRVLGLRSSDDMALKNPAAAADKAAWLGRRHVDQEAQEWTELDLSLITRDSRFLHVGS